MQQNPLSVIPSLSGTIAGGQSSLATECGPALTASTLAFFASAAVQLIPGASVTNPARLPNKNDLRESI